MSNHIRITIPVPIFLNILYHFLNRALLSHCIATLFLPAAPPSIQLTEDLGYDEVPKVPDALRTSGIFCPDTQNIMAFVL